jgi:hypothetical protein
VKTRNEAIFTDQDGFTFGGFLEYILFNAALVFKD